MQRQNLSATALNTSPWACGDGRATNVGGTTIGVGPATCVGFTTCYSGTSSRIATGWTAGAGGEYAFSRNWTAKLEYLYVDLGRNSLNENIVAPGTGDSFTSNFNRTTFNVVRAGINYRF